MNTILIEVYQYFRIFSTTNKEIIIITIIIIIVIIIIIKMIIIMIIMMMIMIIIIIIIIIIIVIRSSTLLKVALLHGCFHVFKIVRMVTNRAENTEIHYQKMILRSGVFIVNKFNHFF